MPSQADATEAFSIATFSVSMSAAALSHSCDAALIVHRRLRAFE
jgi:hypothetical protein